MAGDAASLPRAVLVPASMSPVGAARRSVTRWIEKWRWSGFCGAPSPSDPGCQGAVPVVLNAPAPGRPRGPVFAWSAGTLFGEAAGVAVRWGPVALLLLHLVPGCSERRSSRATGHQTAREDAGAKRYLPKIQPGKGALPDALR